MPIGLPAIAWSTSVGRVHRLAVDGDDHVGRLELPVGREPGLDLRDERAVLDRRDLLAERAERDGRRDLLRRPHLGGVHLILLRGRGPGRDDLVGRVEVGAGVEAAEQLLEQRRLADDHVDEVDAAAVRRDRARPRP